MAVSALHVTYESFYTPPHRKLHADTRPMVIAVAAHGATIAMIHHGGAIEDSSRRHLRYQRSGKRDVSEG